MNFSFDLTTILVEIELLSINCLPTGCQLSIGLFVVPFTIFFKETIGRGSVIIFCSSRWFGFSRFLLGSIF